MMDEVGGGTSQKGDGHIGGKLKVCGKGMEVRQQINTKETRWTLLGLTALNGELVIYIIILQPYKRKRFMKQGWTYFVNKKGK